MKRHEVIQQSERTHDDNDAGVYVCEACHEMFVSLTSVARHVVQNQYEVRRDA